MNHFGILSQWYFSTHAAPCQAARATKQNLASWSMKWYHCFLPLVSVTSNIWTKEMRSLIFSRFGLLQQTNVLHKLKTLAWWIFKHIPLNRWTTLTLPDCRYRHCAWRISIWFTDFPAEHVCYVSLMVCCNDHGWEGKQCLCMMVGKQGKSFMNRHAEQSFINPRIS